MINPLSQTIYIKGKAVNFDSLTPDLQKKLLNLWGIKHYKNYDSEENNNGTTEPSASTPTTKTKRTKSKEK